MDKTDGTIARKVKTKWLGPGSLYSVDVGRDYDLGDQLGRGAYGVVTFGRSLKDLRQFVAIKVLQKDREYRSVHHVDAYKQRVLLVWLPAFCWLSSALASYYAEGFACRK